MTKQYTATRVRDLIAGDQLWALLDVREKFEFTAEHLPWACPVPRGWLEAWVPSLLQGFDAPIVCYGDDDRAARAAATLRELGYPAAGELAGGIDAWKAGGFEVQYGWGVPGKDWGERIFVRDHTPELTVDELAERIATGRALVLDSRTQDEFERGHLPGAQWAAGGELPHLAATLAREHADRDIVVNCAGRTRSIVGAYLLRRMGLENVHALKGGTSQWIMSGRELESGPAAGLELPADATRAGEFAAHVRADEAIATIEPDTLAGWLVDGDPLYLIDTRLPEEWSAGHVPGSISCPLGQVPLASEEFFAFRNARIVTICREDMARSTVAASELRDIGYPNAVVLAGGVDGWQRGGFRLDQSASEAWVVPAGAWGPNIQSDELAQRLSANPSSVDLVDVRDLAGYYAGHLPGARWVPRGRLEDVLGEARAPLVVVYSQHRRRAILALATARTLLADADVRWLDGGIEAWIEAEHETERGLGDSGVDEECVLEDRTLHDLGMRRQRTRGPRREVQSHFMRRYLDWEEQLGEKYEHAEPDRG